MSGVCAALSSQDLEQHCLGELCAVIEMLCCYKTPLHVWPPVSGSTVLYSHGRPTGPASQVRKLSFNEVT